MLYYGFFSRDLYMLHLKWRSPLCLLLALPLCSMIHYDITMGHDFIRDALIVTHLWVTMLLGTSIVTSQYIMILLCVHYMASQWLMTLLGNSFAMYYYTKLWYCCFTSKFFEIVHINNYNQYPINSSMEKKKKKFVVIICGEHVHCFCYGYFIRPANCWTITTQKQFIWSSQSNHLHTCFCYNIMLK